MLILFAADTEMSFSTRMCRLLAPESTISRTTNPSSKKTAINTRLAEKLSEGLTQFLRSRWSNRALERMIILAIADLKVQRPMCLAKARAIVPYWRHRGRVSIQKGQCLDRTVLSKRLHLFWDTIQRRKRMLKSLDLANTNMKERWWNTRRAKNGR